MRIRGKAMKKKQFRESPERFRHTGRIGQSPKSGRKRAVNVPVDEEVLASMTREPDSHYNRHDIFVVSTTDQFFLKVYIDKTDYSIVHLEFEMETAGDNLAIRKGMVSKYLKYTKAIDFRRYSKAANPKLVRYDFDFGQFLR